MNPPVSVVTLTGAELRLRSGVEVAIYPVLFRIGTFEITSFGVLVAIGALIGLWVFGRELRRSGLPANALDAAIAGVIGGMAGAKLLWVAEHAGEEPLWDLVLSRGGMSWFGGVAGGLLAGVLVMMRKRIPILPALAAATPALAIGHAVGRIGCFLVGDDYGRPTDLPWGIAFPQGLPPTTVPVHPTQLYETLALVPVGWLLFRWRAERRRAGWVVGAYLILTGSIRFAIEFVRINERVLGVLTIAHVASVAAALVGVVLLARGGGRIDMAAPAAQKVTGRE